MGILQGQLHGNLRNRGTAVIVLVDDDRYLLKILEDGCQFWFHKAANLRCDLLPCTVDIVCRQGGRSWGRVVEEGCPLASKKEACEINPFKD